jgi:hypothetical protein
VTIDIVRTGDGVLDLDARVNFDEVVPAHLVDKELCRARITVADALRKLDCVGKNRLADLLRQVCRGRDLYDLLVAALYGAVALEEVNCVTLRVGEQLNLDVSWAFEEAFDEDRAVTERRLGLRDGTVERCLEFRLFAHDTHTAASTTHRGLDDHYKGMVKTVVRSSKNMTDLGSHIPG